MNFSIAIDGPSGAGKSTVADALAGSLRVLHLDTGAMYRAFAWQALQEGLSPLDEPALEELATRAVIRVKFEDGGQRTLVNGKDVTELIRTPEISMAASDASKFGAVRRLMVRMQQELAKSCPMVLDGRDIGTKVLPDATLKIFLTATPEVRARRRYEELREKGAGASYEEVLEDVIRRDQQDSTREIDPLRPAKDAVVLDSSGMTREEVVQAIEKELKGRVAGDAGGGANAPASAPKEPFTFTYRLARGVSWLLFHTLFPVRYHAAERIQLDAPFILIANHQSMMDPLVAAWKCKRYQIRFMGKKELAASPFLKALFQSMRMIAVDRHNMDMAAVRACLKALKEGHPLGIFPEGTRHKEGVMRDLESGVAMIALRGGAPLLPAYITAPPRLFRRQGCRHPEQGRPQRP